MDMPEVTLDIGYSLEVILTSQIDGCEVRCVHPEAVQKARQAMRAHLEAAYRSTEAVLDGPGLG